MFSFTLFVVDSIDCIPIPINNMFVIDNNKYYIWPYSFYITYSQDDICVFRARLAQYGYGFIHWITSLLLSI